MRTVFGFTSVSFVDLRGRDSTWSLTSAGAAFNTAERGVTVVEVQRTERPGLTIFRTELPHDQQLAEGTAASLQVSASGGEPLREQWGVGGGLGGTPGATPSRPAGERRKADLSIAHRQTPGEPPAA